MVGNLFASSGRRRNGRYQLGESDQRGLEPRHELVDRRRPVPPRRRHDFCRWLLHHDNQQHRCGGFIDSRCRSGLGPRNRGRADHGAGAHRRSRFRVVQYGEYHRQRRAIGRRNRVQQWRSAGRRHGLNDRRRTARRCECNPRQYAELLGNCDDRRNAWDHTERRLDNLHPGPEHDARYWLPGGGRNGRLEHQQHEHRRPAHYRQRQCPSRHAQGGGRTVFVAAWRQANHGRRWRDHRCRGLRHNHRGSPRQRCCDHQRRARHPDVGRGEFLWRHLRRAFARGQRRDHFDRRQYLYRDHHNPGGG